VQSLHRRVLRKDGNVGTFLTSEPYVQGTTELKYIQAGSSVAGSNTVKFQHQIDVEVPVTETINQMFLYVACGAVNATASTPAAKSNTTAATSTCTDDDDCVIQFYTVRNGKSKYEDCKTICIYNGASSPFSILSQVILLLIVACTSFAMVLKFSTCLKLPRCMYCCIKY
jgi:hypothetical protein